MRYLAVVLSDILAQAKDIVPIVAVIAFFQGVVLRQPLADMTEVLTGLVLLIVGLALFMRGLALALFPAGEAIGRALVRKGSPFWLFAFAFALGFGAAVAEPALITVAEQAANAAAGAGMIAHTEGELRTYALGLRLSVALGVGTGVLLGVLRIVKGWPIYYLLGSGVAVVMTLLVFVPSEIAAIALDSGPLTLSTITVPMVTALGVGLSSSLGGRTPLADGFGLVALAALLPALFVSGYGLLAGAWL